MQPCAIYPACCGAIVFLVTGLSGLLLPTVRIVCYVGVGVVVVQRRIVWRCALVGLHVSAVLLVVTIDLDFTALLCNCRRAHCEQCKD